MVIDDYICFSRRCTRNIPVPSGSSGLFVSIFLPQYPNQQRGIPMCINIFCGYRLILPVSIQHQCWFLNATHPVNKQVRRQHIEQNILYQHNQQPQAE